MVFQCDECCFCAVMSILSSRSSCAAIFCLVLFLSETKLSINKDEPIT